MTKPHLKRKPDGGLYSASELALMRTLDKAGMTMEEYVRRLDSLRDENGSPHCENCGQVEKKRKPNGEIKNLALNLEQKKLLCESCSCKVYKQRMKDTVAKRNDRGGATSPDEFWVRNRNRDLDDRQKLWNELRHDEVVLFEEQLRGCLQLGANVLDDAEFRDLTQDFINDIREFGTMLKDIATKDFWNNNTTYQRLLSVCGAWKNFESYEQTALYGKAAELRLKYGYCVAVESSLANDFIGLIEKYFDLPRTTAIVGYSERVERIQKFLDSGWKYTPPGTVIKCSERGCNETTTIPAGQIPPPQFFCVACTTKHDAEMKEAASRINQQRIEEHVVWGEKADYR